MSIESAKLPSMKEMAKDIHYRLLAQGSRTWFFSVYTATTYKFRISLHYALSSKNDRKSLSNENTDYYLQIEEGMGTSRIKRLSDAERILIHKIYDQLQIFIRKFLASLKRYERREREAIPTDSIGLPEGTIKQYWHYPHHQNLSIIRSLSETYVSFLMALRDRLSNSECDSNLWSAIIQRTHGNESDSPFQDHQIRRSVSQACSEIDKYLTEINFNHFASKGAGTIMLLFCDKLIEHANIRSRLDEHMGVPEPDMPYNWRSTEPVINRLPPVMTEVTVEDVLGKEISDLKPIDQLIADRQPDKRPRELDLQTAGQPAFFVTDTALGLSTSSALMPSDKERDQISMHMCPRMLDMAARVEKRLNALPSSSIQVSNSLQILTGRGKISEKTQIEFLTRRSIDTKGPFACSIFGPWGSGKTSMLHTIRATLEGTATEAQVDQLFGHENTNENSMDGWRDSICINFEPWKYESEPNLIKPLIVEIVTQLSHEIRTQMRAPKSHGHNFDEYLGATTIKESLLRGSVAVNLIEVISSTGFALAPHILGGQSSTLMNVGLIAASGVASLGARATNIALSKISRRDAKRLEKMRLQFGEETLLKITLTDLVYSIHYIQNSKIKIDGSGSKPICIFIDDLDRCSHTQVRRLIEAIKHFLTLPGVVVFMALDEEQVLRALGEAYKGALDPNLGRIESRLQTISKRYLEKFFQYKIDLGDGFSPIPNAAEELVGECWFEFCRIASGHGSAEFDLKLAGGNLKAARYPLFAGIDWFKPGDAPLTKGDVLKVGEKDPTISSKLEVNVNELNIKNEQRRRISNERAVYALAHLFESVRRNPRVIKQNARWLFFTVRKGIWSEDSFNLRVERPRLSERVRDFAEEVFSTNFAGVWVNEFHSLPEESRISVYSETCKLFHAVAFEVLPDKFGGADLENAFIRILAIESITDQREFQNNKVFSEIADLKSSFSHTLLEYLSVSSYMGNDDNDVELAPHALPIRKLRGVESVLSLSENLTSFRPVIASFPELVDELRRYAAQSSWSDLKRVFVASHYAHGGGGLIEENIY